MTDRTPVFHLKFKFLRLLKKVFIGPQVSTLKLYGDHFITVQWKEIKKTLFSRVGTEKITSGEGHEWFLESHEWYLDSPQVKIMSF
jgi:hypothetical protein